MFNLKKKLLLLLTPLALFAGSGDAIIECKSGSGRTTLQFYDQDIQGAFQGGVFTVDDKRIKYLPQYDNGKWYPYSWMNVNLKEGVYSLVYSDGKGTRLKFYALPKSVKRGDKEGFEEYYTFNAIIDRQTSDPRKTSSSNQLNKQIWLGCTLSYSI